MADTAELLRLMQHAADRLAEEDISVKNTFQDLLDHQVPNRPLWRQTAQRQAQFVAASTLAQTVLRLVAAVLTDSDDPAPTTKDTPDAP